MQKSCTSIRAADHKPHQAAPARTQCRPRQHCFAAVWTSGDLSKSAKHERRLHLLALHPAASSSFDIERLQLVLETHRGCFETMMRNPRAWTIFADTGHRFHF